MAYAQNRYQSILQGIPPAKYTIAQIGCFVTSFSNLLSRFGVSASPPRLNSTFIAQRIYIDSDDGVRDDLTFKSITKAYPDIIVTKTGTSKMPPHANAIVKMKARNNFGTHFCLVHSIRAGRLYIVDSWDGAVKPASAYNGVISWATYGLKPKKQVKSDVKTTGVFHRIQKGDTFWALENEYKLKHGTLQKRNPTIDPAKLKIGSKIKIK